MLDLNQLRCFVAVAEELHFGRAAARLHMTQPPLSRQIRLLEDAVGTRLFDRTSRSVQLTVAGTALFEDAARIVRLAEKAETEARRTARGERGRVVIGFTAVAGYALLPRLLALAREALPEIDIVLEEMVSEDLLHALETERLDLALVRPTRASAALAFHRLVSEPMRLAIPAGHPLATRRRIVAADLAGQPLVMYSAQSGRYFHDKIRQLFASPGGEPVYIHHMGQTHTIVALVRAGIGLAIVPESAMHLRFENVEYRPLWRKDVVAEIYLAWRRHARNPAQRRLREFVLASPGLATAQ